MQAILGQKIEQTQKFLEDGTRVPVTRLWISGNTVVTFKTKDKHGYSSLQLGFGTKKNANKALLGHVKGANLKAAPKFLQEIRLNGEDVAGLPEVGTMIIAPEVFKPGDIVDVTGISKGKGYAGVVKRHHFKGGPRTHGQSDRERAPGSIGQTTTPGRVYKGKRMAGRMGHQRVTIKNLEIVDVSQDSILIKGLVPGGKNTLIMVKKVGENKKFVPLFGIKEEEQSEENSDSHLSQVSGDAQQTESKNRQPQVSSDVQTDGSQSESRPPSSLSGNQSIEARDKTKMGEKLVSDSLETGLTDSSVDKKDVEVKEDARQ